MLGKKCSLSPLKSLLKKHNITNHATHELCQGRTMRWTLAWSFDNDIQLSTEKVKRPKKTKMLHFDVDTDILYSKYQKLIHERVKVVVSSTDNIGAAMVKGCDSSTDDVILEFLDEMTDVDITIHRLKSILRELMMTFTSIRPKQTSGSAHRLRVTAKLLTWRNQRSRRRHHGNSGATQMFVGLETPTTFNLDFVPSAAAGFVTAQLEFIGGGDKELLHQIMQCVKNKLYAVEKCPDLGKKL